MTNVTNMSQTTARQYARALKQAISLAEGYIAQSARSLDALPIVGFRAERANLEAVIHAHSSHIRDNHNALIKLTLVSAASHHKYDA
jgi:hypothetical protein